MIEHLHNIPTEFLWLFGSLVVLLVWVYYSAQIFLLGAEFTWVYAHDHGSLADKTPGKTASPQNAAALAPEPAPDRQAEALAGITAPRRTLARREPCTFKQELAVYGAVALAFAGLGLLLRRRGRPQNNPYQDH